MMSKTAQERRALLVSALFHGKAEALEWLRYLPDEEREALQQEAQDLWGLPREQRWPRLARGLARLQRSRRHHPFAAMTSEQMAAFLTQESPRVCQALLAIFPHGFQRRVEQALPPRPHEPLKQSPISRELLEFLRFQKSC